MIVTSGSVSCLAPCPAIELGQECTDVYVPVRARMPIQKPARGIALAMAGRWFTIAFILAF